MSYRTLIFGALVMMVTTGCKVILVVPDYGSVVSESGGYDCRADSRCEIDVVDFFFDESFEALPEAGYEFSHWLARDRGLCGGGSEACVLSTANYEASDALTALINSDEIFYLQPVFRKEIALASTSARACLNPELTAEGTRITASYYSSGALSEVGITASYVQDIGAETFFNGNRATPVFTETTRTGDEESIENSETFLSSDERLAQVLSYGGISYKIIFEASGKKDVRTRLSKSSYSIMNFNMEVGGLFLHQWEEKLDVTRDFRFVRDIGYSRRTTYSGREEVAVPAGTFNTCRFDISDDISEEGIVGPILSQTILWFDAQSGMLIKEQGPTGDVTVLQSATVNGVTIK